MSPRSAARIAAAAASPPTPPQPQATRGFKITVVVVIVFLTTQLAVSVTGAVIGEAETETAALDTFSRVGDITAERVGRYADSARDVTEGIVTRLERVEQELSLDQVAGELYQRLQRETQVRAAYAGFPDGTYVSVRRDGTGYVERRVADSELGRVVELRRDTQFEVYAWEITDEYYDPRERPWYVQGASTMRTSWTEPFLLVETNTPTVTSTRAARHDGEITAVVGADLSLHTLAEVLDQLPVGEGAEAFILAPNRTVIAAPLQYEAQIAEFTNTLGIPPTAADIGVTDEVQATSVLDGNMFGRVGNRYILERALPSDEEVNWILHLEADERQLSPGLQRVQLTMTWTTALSMLIVVLASLLLYRLWRPLEELRLRASTDALTGLANRHEFELRGERLLQSTRGSGTPVVVATLDLDNFKALNDTHGHDVGDKALTVTGQALMESMRDRDLAARFGGDEFVFLLRAKDPAQAYRAVDRNRLDVIDQLAARVTGGEGVGVTAGYAVSDRDQKSLMTLVRQADAAMVDGKRRDKGKTFAAPQSTPTIPAEDRRES
ncbi:MAG: diguanylate cyclase [Demequina sp.]